MKNVGMDALRKSESGLFSLFILCSCCVLVHTSDVCYSLHAYDEQNTVAIEKKASR
jgi:hypothetical protein